jgi:hypothetical protein
MRLEEKRNEKEEEKRWKNNEFKNKKKTLCSLYVQLFYSNSNELFVA